MSAENLFTTSRIENVNQIIAELYDDSILLEKRMESFFLNLNNIVFLKFFVLPKAGTELQNPFHLHHQLE